MTGSFIQMVLGLAFVLSAIAMSAWVARRMGLGSVTSTQFAKVVSTVSVGAKEQMIVVEIGAQWMVLGVAPGRVNLLATIPALERPPEAAAPAMRRQIDFAALFRKARSRA